MGRWLESLSLTVLACVLACNAAPAAAQDRSTVVRWVLEHVGPRLRGPMISDGVKGSPVIWTPTPTLTKTITPTISPTPTRTATPSMTPTHTLPPIDCAARPDGSTCDAGLDFGNTLICIDGECVACIPDAAATPRFIDNGDRTVTDRQTCLVWEQKSPGAEPLHGVMNTYAYSSCGEVDCSPDGTAFTVFTSNLNAARFAGHGDWRLPTSAGGGDHPTNEAAELESLHVLTPECEANSSVVCIDPVFNQNCEFNTEAEMICATGYPDCSCTFPAPYGTRSTFVFLYNSPDEFVQVMYGIYFGGTGFPNAPLGSFIIDGPMQFRAVRGGVVFVP